MAAKNSEKAAVEKVSPDAADGMDTISTKAELKKFLNRIRDKMTEDVAAPIYALSAVNYLLNLPDIYALLDNDNKEIARDIWLRLKKSGVQVRNPPMLFAADEHNGIVEVP